MTEQILKAFCDISGEIVFSREDLTGPYQLASAPDEVLTTTVDKTADMSVDKSRYFVPGFLAAPDDRARTECVMEYQIELNQHLRRVLSSMSQGQDHVSAALAY